MAVQTAVNCYWKLEKYLVRDVEPVKFIMKNRVEICRFGY